MPKRGHFITFEGIDGAGKSTQVEMLRIALSRAGIDWYCTREPGGSSGAEALRTHLLDHDWDGLEETFILMAGRHHHVRTVVKVVLDAGHWVICDRFVDTTVAYQGWGRGVSLRLLTELNEMAVYGCWPDLTVLLDLPAEVARERLSVKKNLDRMEVLGDLFFERARQGFIEQTKVGDRIFTVDATEPADVVHALVIAEVERRFGVSLRGESK